MIKKSALMAAGVSATMTPTFTEITHPVYGDNSEHPMVGATATLTTEPARTNFQIGTRPQAYRAKMNLQQVGTFINTVDLASYDAFDTNLARYTSCDDGSYYFTSKPTIVDETFTESDHNTYDATNSTTYELSVDNVRCLYPIGSDVAIYDG